MSNADSAVEGMGRRVRGDSLESLEEPFERWDQDLEGDDIAIYRRRQTFLNHILHMLNFRTPSRREEELELQQVPILGVGAAAKRRIPREIRRCRRTVCLSAMLRAIRATPVLILCFFGVLHILEALVGRARFFWNDSVYELAFLGKHGTALPHGSASRTGSHGGIRQAMVPIPCHSHNDYWRDEPLLDAIRWGCIGVEADIWLFDDELYVGHISSVLTEDRTLRSMYINPLLRMLDQTRTSSPASLQELSVFETMPAQTLVLLIDFKNVPRDAFSLVQKQLQPLRDQGYLTYYDGEDVHSRAITVVGTGLAPFDMITHNATYRDIFFDAPLAAMWEPPRDPISKHDLLHNQDGKIDYGTAMALAESRDQNLTMVDSSWYNATSSYYASTSFASSVGFVWRGHLSPRQMNIIRGQIRGAKRRGLKARYWATPSWPTALRNHVWHVLMKEGADVLNVDDLEAAALQDWTVPVHSSLW